MFKEIKLPDTGKITSLKEDKHMEKHFTLDQLWIQSSRGQLVLCPVSHCKSSTIRENRDIIVGIFPLFFPPGSYLCPIYDGGWEGKVNLVVRRKIKENE